MAAATCSMHLPYGLGPQGHNLPQGPPQEQQREPSGASRSDDQQQHSKPFFYVQPPQSYLPMQSLQWPLPLSYNPFFSYPGLGYGMPMMPPHYQPNPYVEPPGFVIPHTHLHLMDYRRLLNPQYYQTMAYHSRRFRYQHNSQSRETTTSEVQTEPLLTPQRTSRQTGSDVDSQGVMTARSGDDALSTLSGERLPPATVVPKVDRSPELRDLVSSSTSASPPNGSFTIQTEEVRIECCTTPVGLQLLHAREAAEMSHGFSQDVVQCSSILQSHVLQDEAPSVPDDHSERVCPDILLVGTGSAGKKIPTMGESRSQVDSVTAVKREIENDQSPMTDDFNLKVVHLPFDTKYLDELRKMESSVWSTEETLMPSPESLIQNASSGTLNQTLMAASQAEMVMFGDDGPTEEVAEMNPLVEDGQEDPVSSLEALGDEMVSEADVERSFEVSKETDVTDQTPGAAVGPHLSLKAAGNHHSGEIRSRDHQDTSFESLPAYLPSNRWFSEFDGVFQSGQAPAAPEKRYRFRGNVGLDVPTSKRKLDMEYKDQQGVGICKPKGQAGHGSLSDHEYCLRKSFENIQTSHSPRNDELCSKCVAKHGVCKSAGPGLSARSLKRKAAPVPQRNNGLLPTCEACKSHPKRRLTRKCCYPDVSEPARVLEPEGESLEKSWCRSSPKWRAMAEPKRPLMSKQNMERRPVPMKLKERNGMHHSEPQHQYTPWERLRHCPHSDAIRGMDENSAMPISLQDQWRNQVSVTCRWQADGSWQAVTPFAGNNAKNDARSQHFKHRKAQPPSQGSRRKDARC